MIDSNQDSDFKRCYRNYQDLSMKIHAEVMEKRQIQNLKKKCAQGLTNIC